MNRSVSGTQSNLEDIGGSWLEISMIWFILVSILISWIAKKIYSWVVHQFELPSMNTYVSRLQISLWDICGSWMETGKIESTLQSWTILCFPQEVFMKVLWRSGLIWWRCLEVVFLECLSKKMIIILNSIFTTSKTQNVCFF